MPTGSLLARAEVQLLASTAELEALHDEWEALWRADARATAFQSPHWLIPWWKHIGQGELRTLAVRDAAGVLAGLAPLYLHTDAQQVRHLFPVGIATTDYLEPLARPGCEHEVAAAVLARVDDVAWDVLAWPQLRRECALLRLVGAHPGEPHPVLALPATTIPKSTLANLRTCRNRAARVGALSFQLADAHQVPEFLEALARLHAQRWSTRGLPGVLQDDAVRAAHAEAALLLQEAGVLRLHGLRLDGELVAVLYALMHGRRCCYYIAGFDPRHAFLSPGSLLLAHAIEQATAEGATTFDFLRGAEAYKYRWGAVDQPMFALRRVRR